MQIKSVNFSQLSDILALTILVDDLSHCYKVLGVLHQDYSYVPGRFKDYISTPKPKWLPVFTYNTNGAAESKD